MIELNYGNDEYKYCNDCGEMKLKNEFYKTKQTKDGLSGYCKDCLRIRSIKYRNKNLEKARESTRNWGRINKDKIRSYSEKFAKEKPERLKEYQQGWRRSNPDKLREYGIKREQNKKHKISKKEWLACKEYFDNSCAYCGLHESNHYRMWDGVLKKLDLHKEHVDHEGANNLSNCVPSCQSCNSSKYYYSLEEWYIKENPKFSEERLNRIHNWLNEDYKKYIKVNNK